MEKREIIIIVVMVIALCYGAFVYLIPKPVDTSIDSAQRMEELNTFSQNVSLMSSATRLTDSQKSMIELAVAAWGYNPFINLKVEKTSKKKNEEESSSGIEVQLNLNYTGFLALGSLDLAIINGVEYEIGDQIVGTNAYLVSISPLQIEVHVAGEVSYRVIEIDESDITPLTQ